MLPLFPGNRLPVLQTVQPSERSEGCTKCELSTLTPAGQRCISPDGIPGDILVVGDYPGEFERRLGRPMADKAGQLLRDIFSEVAPGRNVVYTLALGCKPTFKRTPAGKLVPVQDIPTCIEACRGHVAQDLLDTDAQVIFLVGTYAGISVLGSSYHTLSVRTGYGWFYNQGPKPVFFLPDPSHALSNRLVARALREDLARALQSPPSARLLDAQYTVVANAQEARNALLECRKAPYIATDVETSGMMFEDDFRIECVATSTEDHVWVWPREYWFEPDENDLELLPDMPHPYMREILSLPQTSWNGQYDYTAFQCDPEARYGPDYHRARMVAGSRSALYKTEHGSMNLQSDARIKRKLLEADAAADLATAANLIGMGGHKQEARTVLAAICDELRKYRMSFQKTPTGRDRKPFVPVYIKPDKLNPATWQKWFEYLDAGFDEEKFAYRFMPKDILWRYVAKDAFSTWHLEHWCNERLILDLGLATIWEEVSKPAMWAYCEMRMNGMPLDKGGLGLFAQYLETELKQVQAKIDGYKQGLNPGSPKQVGEYLATLGIVPKRKTDTGKPSYADDSLDEYKDKHPIVDLILQHRELNKQLGTYAVGFGYHIRSDGHVHPSYLPDGTEGGRATSSDPNCFTGDTEILTRDRGWVRMDSVTEEDTVAQATPHNGWMEISWTLPESLVQREFDGELVHLHNGHTDLLVTPDHRCPARGRRDGIFREYTALSYPKDGLQVHAGQLQAGSGVSVHPDMVALLCAVQADGHFNGSGTTFYFHKERKYLRLVGILQRLGAEFSHAETGKDKPKYRVCIKVGSVQRHVYETLGPRKVWGAWLLQWDHDSLLCLTEEICQWDGVAKANNHYASALTENMDYVQAAYSLVGKRAYLGTYARSYDKNQTIQLLGVRNVDYSNTANIQRDRVPYSGTVYCVSVPSTYILVRRNGKTMITGNCYNITKGRTPRKKVLADMLRACFKCPPGYELVEVDSGQIEIRGAAHLSGDPDMHSMLTSGTDFHMASAKKFAVATGKDPEKVTDLDREMAKTCIAAGQLVLTHRGLVPIENIGGCDLLWDGVEWVSHDGLLPMGRQKVITYDGLTATPDHRVYLDDGTACPLSEVVASGRRLAISGAGNLPARHPFSNRESYDIRIQDKAQACRVSVLRLSQDVSNLCDEYQARDDDELPMSEARSVRERSSCDDYWETVRSDALPMHGFGQSDVQELRTARDRVQVCFSGNVHSLGLGEPASSDVPRCGHRQDRQLGPLRARESAACVSQGECLQHSTKPLRAVSGTVRTPESCLASDEDGSSRPDIRTRVHQQAAVSRLDSGTNPAATSCGWANVYDIANAGPRHRFTVSDRLVANCNFAAIYEIPCQLGNMLANRLGIPNKQGDLLAQSMFQTYTRLRSWMDELYAESWESGVSRTRWKGEIARRRPLWGMGKNPPTLKALETELRKSRDAAKAYDLTAARSTYNGPTQGSSVDVIASHLWETVLWLRENTVDGQLVLQVYDSIMVMVRTDEVEKAAAFLKAAMTQPLFGETPLTADAKRGTSWGNMKKIK